MSDPFSAIDITVELGFGSTALASSPTWTDVTEWVSAMSVRRGRSSLLSRFDAGTATIRLDNKDGRFDPNNTSSPYSPNLLIGVPVRITVTHAATPYVMFRGMVEAWPLDYSEGAYLSDIDLPCAELTKILAGKQLAGQVFGEQVSHDRVAAVLDTVSWPAGLRDLTEIGLALLPATTFTGPALDHVVAAAEAEVGSFHIASDGTATFRNRTTYSGSPASSATFGPGAGELGYETIDLVYDDDELYNEAIVTAEGGIAQTSDDGNPVLATITRSGDVYLDDNHAKNVAEWLVGIHATQQVRVRGLELAPQFDETNMWPQVLGRDLTDAVTVKFDPPGSGDTVNQLAVIQSVAHDADARNGTWRTVWTLHPLPSIQTDNYWILGTSQLGTETVLA